MLAHGRIAIASSQRHRDGAASVVDRRAFLHQHTKGAHELATTGEDERRTSKGECSAPTRALSSSLRGSSLSMSDISYSACASHPCERLCVQSSGSSTQKNCRSFLPDARQTFFFLSRYMPVRMLTTVSLKSNSCEYRRKNPI